MSEVAQQLEAGGLVPVGAPVPADLPTDTVDGRVYAHPAIPGRVVVRLVPDLIAAGADTELGLLGFTMTGHHDDIARQRRRTLGFPGTALVEDPERARHALDVMKAFRKHAKRIASKPGHARDGFDEIATGLARQVPHFLPSYYEEVARAFAAAGNLTYAATAFDKARTAEREYGLTIDEERRGEAFLEFALLGALTVKSLRGYGKELQDLIGADAAYERMLALAIRRTLGGLPPWASLPKDLRSLAKAAKKKDLVAADQRFLREVIGGSAVQRSAASFWEEYRPALVALGQAEPAIRARLLDLFPTGGESRRTDGAFHATWMSVLSDSGALEALFDPAAPAAALPSGGRAAWFARLQDWAPTGNGWVLQLVRKAAPALKADGAPLPVRGGDYWHTFDLDLLDLLGELAVPWTCRQFGRLQLQQWAAWKPAEPWMGLPAEPRPRDPVHAVADPRVRAALRPAVDAAFGDDAFEAVASRMSALRDLRREWIEGQVADLGVSGIGAAAIALKRLDAATRPSHFAEFPSAAEALAAVDVATALHRTLTTGIFDELGWSAFDQVVAELAPKPDQEVMVTEQWPHLILADARKAWVLGPNGVEHVHDVKTGKEVPDVAAWVGGQLLVAWSGSHGGAYGSWAYWSGAPSDVFQVAHASGGHNQPVTLPDALLVGQTRFTVGDRTAIPYAGNTVLHDRDRSWLQTDGGWRALDRRTGALTPPSEADAPAFARAEGISDIAYFPLPEAIAATSPLPVLDGQYGARTRVPPGPDGELDLDDDLDDDDLDDPRAGEVLHECLSGERFVGAFRQGAGAQRPSMLVRWPGASKYRAVAEERRYWRNAHNPEFYVADPDRPVLALAHGGGDYTAAAWLPIARFWHYLAPRDPAGSAVLRALTPEAAEALLQAGVTEAGGQEGAVAAAVAAKIPEITDGTLRNGVHNVVRQAAALAVRLTALQAARAGGEAPAAVGPAPDDLLDGEVAQALYCLAPVHRNGGTSLTEGIRSLASFLVRDGETGRNVQFTALHHQEWLGRIRALAWVATRADLTGEQRAAMVKLLRTWADSGLADDGATFRLGRLRLDRIAPWVTTAPEDGVVVPADAWRHEEVDEGTGTRRRMLAFFMGYVGTKKAEGPWWLNFVEGSSDGTFRDWPGAVIHQERRAEIRGDRAWLERLCDAIEARGARSMSRAAAEALAERTGQSVAEAAVLLATFPEDVSKDLREQLGLKAVEANVAVQQLSGLGEAKFDLLAAAAPEDPAQLWAEAEAADGAVARLGEAWVSRFGRSVAVPPELMAAADKELRRGRGAMIKQIAEFRPGRWPALEEDVVWEVDAWGRMRVQGVEDSTPNKGLTGGQAVVLGELLAWLVGKLPVGDPLLANHAAIHALLVARLRNPTLLLEAGEWYCGEDNAPARSFFDALGGELTELKRGDDDDDVIGWQRRAGPLVANLGSWKMTLLLRPTALDPTSRDLVAAFRKTGSTSDEERGWTLLQSDDYTALIRRAVDSPLAPGQWEHDPSKSAPQVVRAVAAAKGLDEDAAVLYLQTLTLLEPTKKNVCTWNGWTPKRYAAAAAALGEAGLVLQGKRARSGREHFLPGPWVEARDVLPYEEWKQPLYGQEPGGRAPLSELVPLAPLHLLFERAWTRYQADPPKFEEVRR
jgi:hypothetical protein